MDQQSPAKRHFIRRLWRHWVFKTILFSLVLIFAFYTVERIRGEQAWNAYREKAVANGTKLRLEEYQVPPIPDDENYAAAPIFQKLFATPDGAKETEKLFSLPQVPRTKPGEPKSNELDLTEWQQVFVKERWIPSAGDNAASDVLAALERLEPQLSEIRMASSRPKSRWPVNWSEGAITVSPQFSTLMAATHCFSLRARALLALDRPDEALSEIKHIIRASESINSEPMFIPMLFRQILWAFVFGACEKGVAANKWKPEHLRTISREAAAVNFLASLKFGLTSERGFGNQIFDNLATTSRSALPAQIGGLTRNTSGSLLWLASPRGWIRANQLEYNRLLDLDLEDIDLENERVSPRFSRSDAFMTRSWSSPRYGIYYRLSNIVTPVTVQGSYRAFEKHSQARQLQISCALVLYRTANSEVPQSLDALIPQYLSAVPHDIMDGKPMRYRRNADGSCVLWSIGKNRVDDGGSEGPKGTPSGKALDWIFELPAVPTN